MATTHQLISTSTVGSGGATSLTFSSIPSTYTDLKVFASVRTTNGANAYDILNLQFNGDTGSNYFTRYDVYAYNSSTGSNAGSYKTAMNIGYIEGGAATANTFCNAEIYIPNYTVSNKVRSVSVDIVDEINSTTNYLMAINSSYWNNTSSAINSITFLINSGDPMAQYSSFSLYGIKNS